MADCLALILATMMPVSSSSPLSSLTFNAINRYTNTSKTVSFEALPIMRNEPSSYCSFNNIGGEQEYLYTDVDELNDSDSETYWKAELKVEGSFNTETSNWAFSGKKHFSYSYTNSSWRKITQWMDRRNVMTLGRRIWKASFAKGTSRILIMTWKVENTLMSITLWDCLIGFSVPEIGTLLPVLLIQATLL